MSAAGRDDTHSLTASLRGVDINCAESWLLPSEEIALCWGAEEFFPCVEGTQLVSCSGCTRFASSQTAPQITGAEAHPRSTPPCKAGGRRRRGNLTDPAVPTAQVLVPGIWKPWLTVLQAFFLSSAPQKVLL